MDKQTLENLEKEVENLSKDSGQTRVESLWHLENIVLKKQGEEGLKELKKILEKLKIDYQSYRDKGNTQWMPTRTAIAIWLAATRLFGWTKEEIYEMGKISVSYSPAAKIFLKYFLSLKRTLNHSVDKWGKIYTQGSLEIKELDLKKQNGVITLKNFPTHPIQCAFIKGMLAKVIELSTSSKKVKVTETKCQTRGDNYHEFNFTW